MDEIEKLETLMQLREKGIISQRTLMSSIGISEEAFFSVEEEKFLLDKAKAQMMDHLALSIENPSKTENKIESAKNKEESGIDKSCSPFNFIILE